MKVSNSTKMNFILNPSTTKKFVNQNEFLR